MVKHLEVENKSDLDKSDPDNAEKGKGQIKSDPDNAEKGKRQINRMADIILII